MSKAIADFPPSGRSRYRVMVNQTHVVGWFAVGAFLCGLMSPAIIGIVGEIYVGELLLIELAFLLVLMGGAKAMPTFRELSMLLQLAVLMLFGYIAADIYRDAHPAQFLRGWAKIILVSLDFLALAVVAWSGKRNLWWFILGMGIGGVCDQLYREVSIVTAAGWKAGYALPIASLLGCLSCWMPMKLASLAFVALGAWNLYMDFRIMGAICVLVAAILWIRSSQPGKVSWRRVLEATLVAVFAGGLIVGGLALTQDEFSKRREQSNVGRGAGLKVAAWAIAESPLVGYGSWPMDTRLVNRYNQETEEVRQAGSQWRVNAFISHSQILQGWVEGGLLGVLFWFYYGYWLIRSGWYVTCIRRADDYLPLFLLYLIYGFWSLLMSPFAGSTRFLIAVGVAIICLCAAERKNTGKNSCVAV